MRRLADLDLDRRLSNKDYEGRLEVAQRRWLQLRLHVGGQMGGGELGPGLLLVFEGPDAAGKGGAIKRVVEPLDPRHYRVSTFAKPTFDEKRHHFLWRFYRLIPGLGGWRCSIAAGTGGCSSSASKGSPPPSSGRAAYDEILGFERTLVLEGVILVKFWLQISDEEQLRRFEDRAARPAAAVEDHRRGLAQPQAQPGVRVRRRGHVRAHRPRARAVGPHRRRPQAVRTAARDRGAQRAGRGRACAAGERPSRRSTT